MLTPRVSLALECVPVGILIFIFFSSFFFYFYNNNARRPQWRAYTNEPTRGKEEKTPRRREEDVEEEIDGGKSYRARTIAIPTKFSALSWCGIVKLNDALNYK